MIVFDADSGKYKRHWGAYGSKPDDTKVPDYDPKAPPSKHFNTVHCANVSKDGFVYVSGTFGGRTHGYDNHLRNSVVWKLTVDGQLVRANTYDGASADYAYDFDGTPKNKLGNVVQLLNTSGFKLQDNLDQTIDNGGFLLGDEVAVTVNLEAVKQAPRAAS